MASDEESLRQLIKILKNLLTEGDWEASLLLKSAHKKIDTLYERAESLLNEFSQGPIAQTEEDIRKEKQGYIRVFVSLYQSDYNNLNKWQMTLNSIAEYSVSRPIYRNEEDVQEIIRSKQTFNEAYAAVFIKESDIIPPYAGKNAVDKFGHELLTVRQGAIITENISEFVHLGRHYLFRNGRLLLKS